VDKYNIIYVYPLGFESKRPVRKNLIVFSIVAIVLFQLGMIMIGSTVIERRNSIYLLSFLLVEVMAILTVLEFFRKPWDGLEREAEKTI